VTEDELRARLISELSPDDVFRSQFRAGADAPQSSIEVIDWGLQHIDRLRKAHFDAKETTAKSWQMWLLFAVGILNACTTGYLAYLKATETPNHALQRTGPAVTAPASTPPPSPPSAQVPRQPGQSLSLGSFALTHESLGHIS